MGSQPGTRPLRTPLDFVAEVMDPRAAIREGKRLDRALLRYARNVSRGSGQSYVDALRRMRDLPDPAAAVVGASPAFVRAWAVTGIRRAGFES